ncbi:hypothetical protein TNCV_207791 [Trichonephila clavipes]|nr:hypothetical protein TNCV_207791 [Trichonephila clavipes]
MFVEAGLFPLITKSGADKHGKIPDVSLIAGKEFRKWGVRNSDPFSQAIPERHRRHPSNQRAASKLLVLPKNPENLPSRRSTLATPPRFHRLTNHRHATKQKEKTHFCHAPHQSLVKTRDWGLFYSPDAQRKTSIQTPIHQDET